MRLKIITLRPIPRVAFVLVVLCFALPGCAWMDSGAWWADNEIDSRSREYQERGLSKQEADRNARYDYIQRHNDFPP